MNHHYKDIRDRIAERPKWFDEDAVPRYCVFAPRELANIYASECALVHIVCQSCQTPFLVAFSGPSLRDRIEGHPRTIADAIKSGVLHYGDPPNMECCPAGPTMNSEPIRVVEYWQRGDALDWKRVPTLEISLDEELVSEKP